MTTSVRKQLIEAAEQQFRRFGYRRTTVDEVTRAADMGKGSFYLHFPSKEAAYMAVVEASLEKFLAKADTALHGPGSVPRRLRELVTVTAKHYGGDELLRASLFGEAALVDGAVARQAADIQRSRIRALLTETLSQGISEGSIRSDLNVEVAAAVLFEIGWAVVRSELDDSTDIPLDVAFETFNDIVGMGLITRPSESTR
ncbi:MAG: TetR/AcrR family transcriptional regulator [Acidimicrobiia bacterium]|nr:TetR/AcrR family transcriptional regulator [Acidimicrobiia bacterium]